jgi:hypothetical protein
VRINVPRMGSGRACRNAAKPAVKFTLFYAQNIFVVITYNVMLLYKQPARDEEDMCEPVTDDVRMSSQG